MFTFVLKKVWEFRAENLEKARDIAAAIEIFTPDNVIETTHDLGISEESIEEHWEKQAEFE